VKPGCRYECYQRRDKYQDRVRIRLSTFTQQREQTYIHAYSVLSIAVITKQKASGCSHLLLWRQPLATPASDTALDSWHSATGQQTTLSFRRTRRRTLPERNGSNHGNDSRQTKGQSIANGTTMAMIVLRPWSWLWPCHPMTMAAGAPPMIVLRP